MPTQYLISFLLYFNLNRSFPNTFIIRPIGVTTKKKIIPMIIGDIIFPRNIPNLNQSLFKGVKILELNKPRTKKIKEIIADQTLISSL